LPEFGLIAGRIVPQGGESKTVEVPGITKSSESDKRKHHVKATELPPGVYYLYNPLADVHQT
jgi:hypothetical protein